jgi:hypothetical protein
MSIRRSPVVVSHIHGCCTRRNWCWPTRLDNVMAMRQQGRHIKHARRRLFQRNASVVFSEIHFCGHGLWVYAVNMKAHAVRTKHCGFFAPVDSLVSKRYFEDGHLRLASQWYWSAHNNNDVWNTPSGFIDSFEDLIYLAFTGSLSG